MLEIFTSPLRIKELRKQVAELQNSIVFMISNSEIRGSTTGNPYRSYGAAVQALAAKYEGTAEWGVNQIRNIIDVRSAFIIGQGIQVVSDEKNSRELEFINEMIKHNNFNEEMPQELAKEAEVEGRGLVKLIPNAEKKTIDIRFVSYTSNDYKVEASPDDYMKYISARYKSMSKEVFLDASEFVYRRFAGRIDKVNDVMPKTAMVLRHCEDLDKALWDWRKANHYFGVPTPYFKCADKHEIDSVGKHIEKINWKCGKAFVGTADFKMVEISGTGLASLEKEITMLAKIISGATGVPVHFLGLPDLMSNRSVSTDLFEFINASTNKERHIWEGFYEEVFDKALEMANKMLKTGFRTGIVKANLVSFTEGQIRQLVDTWLPLYNAGIITLDYILKKIPDLDADEVKAAQEESALKMFEAVKRQEREQTEDVEEEETPNA